MNKFKETKNYIDLHFLSLLNTEMAQVVEIIPYEWQGTIYPA